MTFTLPEMIYNVLAAAVVAGVCCGLIGRAFPTARAVERWLDDAEAEAERLEAAAEAACALRDLPAADVAVDADPDEHAGLAVGPQALRPAAPVVVPEPTDEERARAALAVAAMYDALTEDLMPSPFERASLIDPPGPGRSAAAPGFSTGAGGHQREPRNGRGRADRRDYHKHRGPYAAGQERHVTLAQAETEAHLLVWQLRDRARRDEAQAYWREQARLRDEAYEWWRGANWTVAA